MIDFLNVLHAHRTSGHWDFSSCKYWRSKITAANWLRVSVVAAIPRRPSNSRHSATRCSVPVHRSATPYSRCACASTRADNSSSSSHRVGPPRPCWPAAGWSSAKTIRRQRVPITTKRPTRTCTTAPSVMSPAPSSAEIRLRSAVTPRPQGRTPIHPPTSTTVVQPAATWHYSLPSAGPLVLLSYLYLFIYNSNGHIYIVIIICGARKSVRFSVTILSCYIHARWR